jgi:5'-3' exonuclease
MGIPFYFSYIVKNHSEIIKKLNIKTNNFFLDCNSIIYDVVNVLKSENTDNISNQPIKQNKDQTINQTIIYNVIKKIEDYIDIVSPDKIVYIAFDGVAPVAKLKQQKERRYKSWFQSEINKARNDKNETNDKFNTCQITPGTLFMDELNKKIFDHFNAKKPGNPKNPKIIVSTSSEYGEGEHKIFDFIRNSNEINNDDFNLVYGLDADLIMLCINHLPLFPNTYLFRETPEFIKSLDDRLEPNSHYYLDIPQLSEAITDTMNDSRESSSNNRVYDYIFICFLLGNDFMPHFPAINIRTGGIHKLLEAYKEVFGREKNEIITNGKTIYWKNLRKLIQYLANKEELYIIKEMILRDSMENRMKTSNNDVSDDAKLKQFEIIPILERYNEKYINPKKIGWQQRYYEVLFNIRDYENKTIKNTSDTSDENTIEEQKKKICMNYLEGLEWTMKYYTSGCVDYKWCYKYNYPPLLVDLLQYIPVFERDLIQLNNTSNKKIHPYVQLSYVLPRDYLSLLPEKIHKKLIKERSDWFSTDCDFEWSFCKYFWESHVLFPEKMSLEELEKFLKFYVSV